MTSRRSTIRGRRTDAILTCFVIVCTFASVYCEQGASETWDEISHLIPSNLVYEQRQKNVSVIPDTNTETQSHSQRQNNIADATNTRVKANEDEQDTEEVYEDEYETEADTRVEVKDSLLPKIGEDTQTKERTTGDGDSPRNVEAEDVSRDEDYLEDPSTSQYDTYYYYDDYESGNRSRYEAIEDIDTLDYPDAEEEEEDEVRTEDHDETNAEVNASEDPSEESTTMESKTSDDLSEKSDVVSKKEVDTSTTSTSDFVEETSMEGSDRTYKVIGVPAKHEDDSQDTSILIGEAIVSVVTTKSVVNGTISVPTTLAPATTEQMIAPPSSTSIGTTDQPPTSVTTEDSSRILASVQTSRSVSGARFLPFPVIDRVEPIESSLDKKASPPPESTESIIDKLDRVQSELSSGFLAGGFRTAGNTLQLDVIGERDHGSRRRFTTTSKTPVINKFVPRRYNDKKLEQSSTTTKSIPDSTLDNLEGLLPRDYITLSTSTTVGPTKTGFRWPSSKSTTTTTKIPETKPTTTTTSAPTKKPKTSVVIQDISAFLPPGYKLRKQDTTTTESSLLLEVLAKSKVDISSLLPKDFNKKENDQAAVQTTKTETSTTTGSVETSTVKTQVNKSLEELFTKGKFDISFLLPADYEEKKKEISPERKITGTPVESSSTEPTTLTTTKKPGGLKVVFPSRPGGRKPIYKITTPQSPRGDAAGPPTPKIQKGWPTRATTEFTGWPTPSTTPISIEKLLEAARTATVASVNASLIPITNIVSSTTTTSTTTTTPRPTTPGTCEEECEVAGTIRIIGNATWVPELLDQNTHEWKELANEIEQEMNFVFSKSAILANWFKAVRIDSFSPGSILVDYFVELGNLQQKINTQELRVIFHDSLRQYNAHRWNQTNIKESIRLGTFTIDPKYTDFVVIPKAVTPQYMEKDDRLIPQWAIAIIVIGVGGLLFIIIFGVSVLVNRQNRSKLKPSISEIYEEEVSKNITSHRNDSKPMHTIWTDPDVSWNDKSFESTSNKVLVEKPFQDTKKYNMYDSWRSEWNGYYYNPSQSSSKYGYDSTTNLSSRQHPDYDTNF